MFVIIFLSYTSLLRSYNTSARTTSPRYNIHPANILHLWYPWMTACFLSLGLQKPFTMIVVAGPVTYVKVRDAIRQVFATEVWDRAAMRHRQFVLDAWVASAHFWSRCRTHNDDDIANAVQMNLTDGGPLKFQVGVVY